MVMNASILFCFILIFHFLKKDYAHLQRSRRLASSQSRHIDSNRVSTNVHEVAFFLRAIITWWCSVLLRVNVTGILELAWLSFMQKQSSFERKRIHALLDNSRMQWQREHCHSRSVQKKTTNFGKTEDIASQRLAVTDGALFCETIFPV